MKRVFLTVVIALVSFAFASAQKYATVDMAYILKNIPAYERANEQLNQQSKRWQGEIELLLEEAETLYKKYQGESAFLSDEQRVVREEEILLKEKEAAELKRKYFGSQGELFKKRESLMAPIQEEVFNAVKEVCNSRKYTMVIDKSSTAGLIYSAPSIDISNMVLTKLGYGE